MRRPALTGAGQDEHRMPLPAGPCLVTGATGFVGKTLVREIRARFPDANIVEVGTVSYTHLTLPTTPYV